MVTRVDAALPVHALTVSDVDAMDLGPKARVYAAGGVPEYWVLDVKHREIVVHRMPSGSHYEDVRRVGDTVTAATVALTVPVANFV